jgi:type IV secretion system protein VirD4
MFQLPNLIWYIFLCDLLLAVLALWGLPRLLQKRWSSSGSVDWRLLEYKPHGFVFGKRSFRYVCKKENIDGHILVLGGSGSGKTSCLAVPSLLSWRSRVFAVDIKGELYQKTAWKRGWIKAFNPLDPKSCGYNPFYILDQSDNLVGAARQIVLSLINQPADVRDPFWVQAAQNLFTGSILHFYHLGYSFIKMVKAIQDLKPSSLVKQIAESPSQDARRFIGQFLDMDVKTLAGIYAELSNKLAIFATDPLLQECLSRERFIRPDDLEEGRDIYLLLPEDKLEAWQGLLTLIVNQFLRRFEQRKEGKGEPILFLLDEFPRLGKIEAVKGIATLRSKKVTICLLVQSLAQLDFLYGKSYRQVIVDNCAYKAILNATDADTQEYFSRLVGTMEQPRLTQTTNFKNDTQEIQGKGTSETTIEKRLVKPEKFATLDEIVLLSPFGFCWVKKTSCYRVRAFQKMG